MILIDFQWLIFIDFQWFPIDFQWFPWIDSSRGQPPTLHQPSTNPSFGSLSWVEVVMHRHPRQEHGAMGDGSLQILRGTQLVEAQKKSAENMFHLILSKS